MTKLTQNKTQDKTQDQGFAYHLGKDIANLELSISELLKIKQGVLEIAMPAYRWGYHEVNSELTLPENYQNALCLLVNGSMISLINTGVTFNFVVSDVRNEIYLIKVANLDQIERAAATLNADDVRIEEQEKQRAEEAKRREEEAKRREDLIYRYLAKYLTEKYLAALREKHKSKGYQVFVNKNGLSELLHTPFETDHGDVQIPESDVAEIKQDLLAEKAHAESGVVDLQTSAGFVIEQYDNSDWL